MVGVILLLVFMMFSGANPTLLQLQSNALLGSLLYYPTYLSFLRYTQELYYLIEVQGYRTGVVSMAALFGYLTDDWLVCWTALFAFCFVLRLLAYVALIVVETRGSSGGRQRFFISALVLATAELGNRLGAMFWRLFK